MRQLSSFEHYAGTIKMKRADAEHFISEGALDDAQRVRNQIEHLPIGGVTTREMQTLGNRQREAVAEVDRMLKEART